MLARKTVHSFRGAILLVLLLVAGRSLPAQGSHPFQYRELVLETQDAVAAQAVGDFNLDGQLDIVHAIAGLGELRFHFADASGNLSSNSVVLAVGGFPISLVAEDLDLDGDLDLVVAQRFLDQVLVLLGNGDGTFAQQPSIPTQPQPWTVLAGDFDGDGLPDLVVAGLGWVNYEFHRGTGGGNYSAPTVAPIGVLGGNEFGVTCDFDGDGRLDFALLSEGGPANSALSVHRSLGAGGFAPFELLPVGMYAVSLEATDLDGDGDDELVTVQNEDEVVFFGSDTVASVLDLDEHLPLGGGLLSCVRVADLDQDGVKEVVTVSGNIVSSFRRRSAGDFDLSSQFLCAGIFHSAIVEDLNGDGEPDLSLIGTDSAVRFGSTNGFGARSHSLGDGAYFGTAAGDVDADGDQDLVLGPNFPGFDAILMRNQGAGELVAEPLSLGIRAPHVALGDFDGDGAAELVVADSGSLVLFVNDGAGGFSRSELPLPYLEGTISQLEVNDADEDGFLDIVVANDTAPGTSFVGVMILRGLGGGAFALPLQVSMGGGWSMRRFGFGDLNGDQIPDLVATTGAPREIHLALGTGGGFGPTMTQTMDVIASGLALGDQDGDGICDVALAGRLVTASHGATYVLHGQASGTLGVPTIDPIPSGAGLPAPRIASGDWNGDGLVDLVTGIGSEVWLLEADGTSRFNHTKLLFRSGIVSPLSADIDGDGAEDVVANNAPRKLLTLLTNATDHLRLELSQPAPGAPLVLGANHLNPGTTNRLLFSLDLCPGAPGSGGAAEAGLCLSSPSNTLFYAQQIASPVGTPFHFLATDAIRSWPPVSTVGLAGLSFEAVAVELDVNGAFQRQSLVRRMTLR